MNRRLLSKYSFVVLGFAIPVALHLMFSSAINHQPFLTVLADSFGIGAASMLLLSVILSARLQVFDRFLFGLDNLYQTHYLLSAWTVVFLCLHSGLIIYRYSRLSLITAYNFLLPNTDWWLMAGKLAFATLLILVLASVYLKLRYRFFVLAMRVMGLFALVGWLHGLFVAGSNIRHNWLLLTFMSFLALLAAIAYVYRSLFRGNFNRVYNYKVAEVKLLGSDILQIVLMPKSSKMVNYAGQFCFVSFDDPAVLSEQHPFTISSGSDDERVILSVKSLGDYTSKLSKLSVGSLARIEGPFGSFTQARARNSKQVWVAGGIGITPFLSMVRSWSNYHGKTVKLYYCVRSRTDAIFAKELTSIAQKNPGFSFELICDDSSPKLTASYIGQQVNIKDLDVMLCGPPPMMRSLKRQFIELGVSHNNIYTEEFQL